MPASQGLNNIHMLSSCSSVRQEAFIYQLVKFQPAN